MLLDLSIRNLSLSGDGEKLCLLDLLVGCIGGVENKLIADMVSAIELLKP